MKGKRMNTQTVATCIHDLRVDWCSICKHESAPVAEDTKLETGDLWVADGSVRTAGQNGTCSKCGNEIIMRQRVVRGSTPGHGRTYRHAECIGR